MIPLINKINHGPANSDYPYGSLLDDDGTGNGTNLNAVNHQDVFQFFERLMNKSGLSPNGLPDNNYSGFQLWDAFMKFMGHNSESGTDLFKKTAIFQIGDWNMDTTATITKLVSIGTVRQIVRVSAMIFSDTGGTSADYTAVDILLAGSATARNHFAVPNQDVLLSRDASGVFDASNYSNTGYNRGYIILEYIQ